VGQGIDLCRNFPGYNLDGEERLGLTARVQKSNCMDSILLTMDLEEFKTSGGG
jgi:hypothetical protein